MRRTQSLKLSIVNYSKTSTFCERNSAKRCKNSLFRDPAPSSVERACLSYTAAARRNHTRGYFKITLHVLNGYADDFVIARFFVGMLLLVYEAEFLHASQTVMWHTVVCHTAVCDDIVSNSPPFPQP